MENNEQFNSMKKFGFSNREIKWIIKRANRLEISIDTFLLELSSVFLKVLKCHIVVAVVIVAFIVLDHENIDIGVFLSYIFTYLIGCICVRTQGPLIKSFKSYRMLKKQNKYKTS